MGGGRWLGMGGGRRLGMGGGRQLGMGGRPQLSIGKIDDLKDGGTGGSSLLPPPPWLDFEPAFCFFILMGGERESMSANSRSLSHHRCV